MPKIFAISDLHLSFNTDKPMNVFGNRWNDYEDKIKENWQKKISPDDIVLIAGDTSWQTYVRDAYLDFSFLENLNGTKIISKGNHDYWWETLSKLNKFLADNSLKTIKFIHNTCVKVGDVAICGTKGYPETEKEPTTEEEKKLYNRELLRLSNAIDAAKKTNAKKIIVMLHYPPGTSTAFFRKLKEENVDFCVFGHLHASFEKAVIGNVSGIEYRLTSCDYLKFEPIYICDF